MKNGCTNTVQLLSTLTLILVLFPGCIPPHNIGQAIIPDKPAWTVLVYMAADNHLESAALKSINELEAGLALITGVQVIVLIDRSSGHDASDGNWNDTRLYRILPQNGPPDSVIISQRLDCPPLGIRSDGMTELDLTDSRILELFIDWSTTNYPAQHTALILWGHADGWRTILFDEHTGNQMSMAHLARSLGPRKIDLIGLDCSFGATIENLYELAHFQTSSSDSPVIVIGSPGMVPVQGWNYHLLFKHLSEVPGASDLFSPNFFAESIVSACGSTWPAETASLAAVYLERISELFAALETFSMELASCVSGLTERDLVRTLLLYEIMHHDADSWPSDRFLEINDLATVVYNRADEIAGNPEAALCLRQAAEAVITSLGSAVLRHGNSRISIQLIPLAAPDLPGAFHSPWYYRNSALIGSPCFVKDSRWWVPSVPVSVSLLDRLFYTSW